MVNPSALFLLSKDAYSAVYEPHAAADIARMVRLAGPPQTGLSIRDNMDLLRNVDFIFSGWGMPKIDAAFLEAAPQLKVIFYGAGAVNGWATEEMWERGIKITTANCANAIPVAEYTLATILFSLKHGWRLSSESTRYRGFAIRAEVPGNYGSVVGLIGLGTIGRLVVQLLQPFDVKIIATDPFLTEADALALGVRKVELDELFAMSDVVSLHAPDVPQTRGMIEARHLRAMPFGSTFINTARGRLVREDELAAVLAERGDLHAVLDVTEIEPLPDESPLRDLPNITLTPHIAGSQGRECQRMGQFMVDELKRHLDGRPLMWQVKPDDLSNSVHQLVAR